jgi:hypothetical protein
MPLSARLGATPFDIEMTVRLQPKPAFDINRNGRSTSPKYAGNDGQRFESRLAKRHRLL